MPLTDEQAREWDLAVRDAQAIHASDILVWPETIVAIEAERQEMVQRIEALQGVCAEAYQLAGTLDAPTLALDKLSSAAGGKSIPEGTYLPVQPTDWQARAEKAERRLAEVEGQCAVMRETLEKIVPIGDRRDKRNKLAYAALATGAGTREAAVLAAARECEKAARVFKQEVECTDDEFREAEQRERQAQVALVAAVEALEKEEGGE